MPNLGQNHKKIILYSGNQSAHHLPFESFDEQSNKTSGAPPLISSCLISAAEWLVEVRGTDFFRSRAADPR
jgi:hypothetical protein